MLSCLKLNDKQSWSSLTDIEHILRDKLSPYDTEEMLEGYAYFLEEQEVSKMTITKTTSRRNHIRVLKCMGMVQGIPLKRFMTWLVPALNLSNIANLKRYGKLDMDGCDSFGQDCGADMTERF